MSASTSAGVRQLRTFRGARPSACPTPASSSSVRVYGTSALVGLDTPPVWEYKNLRYKNLTVAPTPRKVGGIRLSRKNWAVLVGVTVALSAGFATYMFRPGVVASVTDQLVGRGARAAAAISPLDAINQGGVTATTTYAQSQQWTDEGNRIIQTKEQEAESNPQQYNSSVASSNQPSSGFYAYQSSPINITGNGSYLLNCGPVASYFNFPQSPMGFGTEYPLDTLNYFTPAFGVASMVTIDGQQYLQIPMTVSNFAQTYPQFSIWIS